MVKSALGLAVAISVAVPASARAAEAQGVLGVQFGAPLRASGTIGRLTGKPCADCNHSVHGARLVRLSGGQGGIKVSAGIGGGFFRPPVRALGLLVSAVAIRTWGSPVGAEDGATFVGAECELALYGRAGAGAAMRVGGDGSREWLFLWSLGAGF